MSFSENCFCCSCMNVNGDDAHCRNHGWDGLRGCERHGNPQRPPKSGVALEDVAVVQARREARRAREAQRRL